MKAADTLVLPRPNPGPLPLPDSGAPWWMLGVFAALGLGLGWIAWARRRRARVKASIEEERQRFPSVEDVEGWCRLVRERVARAVGEEGLALTAEEILEAIDRLGGVGEKERETLGLVLREWERRTYGGLVDGVGLDWPEAGALEGLVRGLDVMREDREPDGAVGGSYNT